MRIFIFKPDGIGDFVLATGALRVMAAEVGEENLVICVKSILVPLARAQFPKATVRELPTVATRKILNLFTKNLILCTPLFLWLLRSKFDASVCLRSMRNYLELFLFYAPRARRYLAAENVMLRSGHKVRSMVEGAFAKVFGAELLDYPKEAILPLEIESHRLIVSRLFQRDVTPAEVIPTFHASPSRQDDYWICAPITNLAKKVYPFPRWVEVFRELSPLYKRVLLVGAPEDRPRLEELLGLLKDDRFEIFLPKDLNAYVDLISGARLMLTIDTAAAHFATALDIRTLVLFSGLHRGMFCPWQRSERQIWLQPEMPPGQEKAKWYKGLPPERAAAEARRLLAMDEVAPSPGHR